MRALRSRSLRLPVLAGALCASSWALALAGEVSPPREVEAPRTTGPAITLDLQDATGVLPIIEIPANTPVPLGPNPGEAIETPPRNAGEGILYGVLRQGSPDGALSMAVYRGADGAERLVIDANDNENLDDDPALNWEGGYGPPVNGQPTLPKVTRTLQFKCPGGSFPLTVLLRRYDREQASGVSAVGLANGIVVSIDSYRTGELEVDGKQLGFALIPTGFAASGGSPFDQPGTAVVIDVNGDGKLNGHPFRSNERFRVGSPFVLGAHGFKVSEVSCDGRRVTLLPVDPAQAQVARPNRSGPQTGELAPNFTVTTTDGATVKLTDLRGKVVLLDFWATWCGPCRMEMPYVRQAYERFHGRGLEILGVSLDNTETEVKAFTTSSGMPWPQTVQGRGLPTPIKRDYMIMSIPAAFLIDREGRIVGRNLRGEGLLQAIENLLGTEGASGERQRSD